MSTNTVHRNLNEILRDEMLMRDQIVALLKEGPMTIPSVSEAIGHPTREVMLWMMGMRRYGLLEEVGRPDDDGYFEYELKEGGA